MDVRSNLANPAPPINYSHAQILRVISGIVLCMLLAALDQTAVVPAVPAIARDLHSYGHVAWIVTAYLLTSTAVTPVFGKLSDTYGRRALLIPAIVIFILASILCAISQSISELIIFRGLQGIGGGGLLAMAQAAIADVVSPRERGRYQGYLAGTWAIASIAGPVIGGYVTDDLSWRWIFWSNLPLGLLAIYLCDRALRLLVVIPRRSRIDLAGAALLTGSISVFLVTLSWGGVEYSWTSVPVLLLAAFGFCLLGVLVWYENYVIDPLLPPRLFANDTFLHGVAVAFFASLGVFVGTFLLPLDFQLLYGYHAESSGLLIVPFLVANTAGAYVSGRLTRRTGKTKSIILLGLGAAAIGFFLLAISGAGMSAVLLMVESIVVGTGVGMCGPTSIVVVQNTVERRDLGAATGAFLLLRSMGGAFGSTIAGALLTMRFAEVLRASGIEKPIGLGSLSQGKSAFVGLPENTGLILRHALVSGFDIAYFVSGILMLLSFLVTLRLRDQALKTTITAEPAMAGH